MRGQQLVAAGLKGLGGPQLAQILKRIWERELHYRGSWWTQTMGQPKLWVKRISEKRYTTEGEVFQIAVRYKGRYTARNRDVEQAVDPRASWDPFSTLHNPPHSLHQGTWCPRPAPSSSSTHRALRPADVLQEAALGLLTSPFQWLTSYCLSLFRPRNSESIPARLLPWTSIQVWPLSLESKGGVENCCVP